MSTQQEADKALGKQCERELRQQAEAVLRAAFQKVCELTGATKVKATYSRFDLSADGTGISSTMDFEQFFTKQKVPRPLAKWNEPS